ncbi:MAG: hypothetical protein V4714_21350 [Bacteroidota bacterium]
MENNTNTLIAPQPTEEKKILMSYDEQAADAIIDTARDQVEVFQALVDEYHSFNFPRKITDMQTLVTFMSHPGNFIFQERLKALPKEINGIKIDQVAFLNHVAVPPAELSDYLDRVNARPPFDPSFYFIDEDSQISFDEEVVPAIQERFKKYAVGPQAEAHILLGEMAIVAAKLTDLGFDVQLPGLMEHRSKYLDGKPTRFVYSENLCLRAKLIH